MPSIAVRAVVVHDLDAELVLEVGAGLDAVGHVAAMEVRIAARRDLRLFPDQRVDPGDRFPVELGQTGLAFPVDEAKRVYAEALHRPVRPGDAAITHIPEHVVGGFCVQRHEVPERVVCRLCLRDFPIGMGLAGVDDVRELDAVLDEEHRNVVADQVEIAFLGVELHRESAGVSHGVSRPTRAQHRREPAEHLRLLAFSSQETGLACTTRRCRMTRRHRARPRRARGRRAPGSARGRNG